MVCDSNTSCKKLSTSINFQMLMNMENSVLWKKVLGEIEVEISRGKFIALFKPTSLLSFEKKVATIACPSTMVLDLLQKSFFQLIKKTLDKYTESDTQIIFVPKAMPSNKEQYLTSPLFKNIEEKIKAPVRLPRLNPDYTFETLAVSSSNQLAYVSATAVAKKVGKAYNPLFIYGPVGVGKTHLMQAIANEVYKKNPSLKIIYITSEEFTNEVVEAIQTNTTTKMKKKFRSVNLLIIDDVQFFAGKEKVQEEVFHTFNTLVDEGGQIVLSSDRPPGEIKKLEKRLSSRFSGGLTVDIAPLDFELKTAILLIKAKKYGIDLAIDIAQVIANTAEDARTLEGNLLRVITGAKTKKTEITAMLVGSLLNNNKEKRLTHYHPDDIVKSVCSFYDVKPSQIRSAKRNAFLVKARQICMYFLKKELNLPYAVIGNLLGGRDHTTIMHGVEKIEKYFSIKKNNGEIMGISSYLEKHYLQNQ